MKNDIKKLYRKDPKLAIQVAKTLGYKIVVVAEKEEDKQKVSKNQKLVEKERKKDIKKHLKDIQKVFDTLKAPKTKFTDMTNYLGKLRLVEEHLAKALKKINS